FRRSGSLPGARHSSGAHGHAMSATGVARSQRRAQVATLSRPPRCRSQPKSCHLSAILSWYATLTPLLRLAGCAPYTKYNRTSDPGCNLEPEGSIRTGGRQMAYIPPRYAPRDDSSTLLRNGGGPGNNVNNWIVDMVLYFKFTEDDGLSPLTAWRKLRMSY